MAQVGDLQKLHEKYFDRGLRIIAISAEPSGTIQSKLVDEKGVTYWVASDPSRATLGRFTDPGGIGIPHGYIVDASGTIIDSNASPRSLTEARIEELLQNTFDPALDRDLHSALKPAVKLYDKGQFGKAWAAVARHVEHEDRVLAADARYLREKAQVASDFHKKLVEKAIADKDYATAYDDLKAIAKNFAGMDVAGWAAETKRTLDADGAVANELKAWKAYLKAQGKEEKAKGKAKKLKPAVTAYKRIVKSFPGTRAAELAEKALERLPR